MAGNGDLRVGVDREACAGHGRCYDLAPDFFAPDDEGFATVVEQPAGPDLPAELRRARANCPERAVLVTGEP
jgi:ferredoxin